MTEEHNQGGVVDASIFDVSHQALPDLPPFLDRTAGESRASVISTGFGAGVVANVAQDTADDQGGSEPQYQPDPALNETWQETSVEPSADKLNDLPVNEAPFEQQPAFVANAPSEVEKQGSISLQGEAAPEHAPIGHNQAPPEPMTAEDMIKAFNRDIAQLGKDSGKGAAALPRLGLRVVRAAADGLISTEKPKAGEKSDAVRIYEAYAANDSKHSEHTNGGLKANAAKLNALIGLGCMTTVDGVEVADRVVSLRDKMEEEELKPKALFAGLVDAARAQMSVDTALTDDAIREALTKTKADKTLEKEWQAINKRVEKLIAGEGPDGLKDQSESALKIGEMIHEHLNAFVDDSVKEDFVAACMERGMTRAQADEFAAKR